MLTTVHATNPASRLINFTAPVTVRDELQQLGDVWRKLIGQGWYVSLETDLDYQKAIEILKAESKE